jgi:hypothetical protein
LDAAFNRALSTLKERQDQFDALANELLEVEEVSGNRVLALVKGEVEPETFHTETSESEADGDVSAEADEATTNGEVEGRPVEDGQPDDTKAENGQSDLDHDPTEQQKEA